MAWERNTPWRQGSIVPADLASALGLLHSDSPDRGVLVVVSHDCDITQSVDRESLVEVIIGRRVDRSNGNLTHAKNSRKLHLAIKDSDGYIELEATNKRSIPKEALAKSVPKNEGFSSAALSILQRWLAARYRRSAFPDEFDRRLSQGGAADSLKKLLTPTSGYIAGIFFDIDDGEEFVGDLSAHVFVLDIYVLYDSGEDPAVSEERAQTLAKAIEDVFRRLFQDADGAWTGIELRYCGQISDEAMSYRQLTLLKKWNVDHISLKAGADHPIATD